MSRLPRALEFLKTGFNAEAASAARFRAVAVRADREGKPILARALRTLAEEKDSLALTQLEAAGQVRGPEEALATAVAEERYENASLYPRMIHDVDAETASIFKDVVARQEDHAARLERLLEELDASTGDVSA